MNELIANNLIRRGLTLIQIAPHAKVPPKGYKWREVGFGYHEAKDFAQSNIGVKCGEPLPDGGYLVAIDVDPRSHGDELWKHLANETDFPEVPDTMTVVTGRGDGGKHFYFRSKSPLGKCKPWGNGVDVQGVGGYVVGPGSVHPETGKPYLLETDANIEWLPEALEAQIEKAKGEFFDGSDIPEHFSERQIVSEGGRDDYLTQVAGGLRRSGLGFESIYAALTIHNRDHCKPPLNDSDLKRIAKSVQRYEPTDVVNLAPKEINKKDTHHNAKFNDLGEIYETADGLMKDIAAFILNHADRPYPHIAIASAAAIIATCAQGGYFAPGIGAQNGGSLSSYFWIVAPSAGGKEAYRSAVEKYLDAVDERLVFSKFGSAHGLRAALFCSNSGISVIDEMQDELNRLGGKNSPGHLMQILTEMKELTNDLDRLKPVNLAKARYPAIKFPRYSIFGVGTTEGLMKHLNGSLIGGGLLSRFVVVPAVEVPSRSFQGRLSEVPEEHRKRLKAIYQVGLTIEGQQQNIADELARFHNDPKAEHRQQHQPSQFMAFEPLAKLAITDFYKEQEQKYFGYLRTKKAETDISPGSIADRAPRLALKASCWHAIGCGRVLVSVADVQWGIKFASMLSEWLCQAVSGNAGDTPLDRACNRILAALGTQEKPLGKTAIHHATGRHLSSALLHQALETLVSAGDINVFHGMTDVPLDINGTLPKSRGLTFAVPRGKL